jgi:hypothetical protein
MNARISGTPGTRPLLVGAVIGCALATASLAPATSALPMRPFPVPPISGPDFAHFTASASGSQTTIWKAPTRAGGDCYYRYTWKPKGREVVRFKSVTTKLLAINFGIAADFKYGTWDPMEIPADFWPANGTTTRLDQSVFTAGPGPCGSKPMPTTGPDCSPTRVRHWNLILQYDKTGQKLEIEFDPVHSPRDGARGKPFVTCPLGTPPGADGDTISTIEAPFPSSELFGVDTRKVVVAHHVWSRSVAGFQETTTVNWKLTLVRHS